MGIPFDACLRNRRHRAPLRRLRNVYSALRSMVAGRRRRTTTAPAYRHRLVRCGRNRLAAQGLDAGPRVRQVLRAPGPASAATLRPVRLAVPRRGATRGRGAQPTAAPARP